MSYAQGNRGGESLTEGWMGKWRLKQLPKALTVLSFRERLKEQGESIVKENKGSTIGSGNVGLTQLTQQKWYKKKGTKC